MLARRIFDCTLLVGILTGGAWSWRLGVERATLEADLARLSVRAGELIIGNSGLILARAAPIAPGRHRVALVQSLSDGAYKLTLTVDGAPCLAVAEPLAWMISDSATGRGAR